MHGNSSDEHDDDLSDYGDDAAFRAKALEDFEANFGNMTEIPGREYDDDYNYDWDAEDSDNNWDDDDASPEFLKWLLEQDLLDDDMPDAPPADLLNFVNKEIVDKLRDTNRRLVEASAGQPAVFEVELVQDAMFPAAFGCAYDLRFLRREHRTPTSDEKGTGIRGAVQLISNYRLKFQRDASVDARHQFATVHECSSLQTYAAAAALQNEGTYFFKKYAKLLIHLSVFCGASARKCMQIWAMRPATAKVYRVYDEWSSYWTKRFLRDHPGVKWNDPNYRMSRCDLCRFMDASLLPQRCNADELDSKLTEERVLELKADAAKNIEEVLDAWVQQPEFYLEAGVPRLLGAVPPCDTRV